MSDETLTGETKPKGADTLTKITNIVLVDGKVYAVDTFKFAKTIRCLSYLTEVAEVIGAADAARNINTQNYLGETEFSVANFLSEVVKALPKLLKEGTVPLFKVLGLVVTNNRELFTLEDQDGFDLENHLMKTGRDIARYGSFEEIVNVLMVGAAQMGTETIVKNLGPLLAFLRR